MLGSPKQPVCGWFNMHWASSALATKESTFKNQNWGAVVHTTRLKPGGIAQVGSATRKDAPHWSLFSSVQLLSRVRLFATPWITAHQASLSITTSQSLPKLVSIESVMPSSHLILCRPLLLLPSIFPSIRVFSNESVLRIRWPKDWCFSVNISPSNEHSGLIPLGWTGWISLQSKGLSGVFSNTTVQKYQFFSAQLSSQSNSHKHTWLLEKP